MERGLSASVHSQKKREDNVKEDKISNLPDEVLVSILSLLTMHEAASTSVLSRRWRKVWTFIPRLTFDASETLLDLKEDHYYGVATVGERKKYVNWVNQVLESYQGSTIDDFIVRFDLNDDKREDIDKWVNFAFEKKVRRLVLDFRTYHYFPNVHNIYLFPQLFKTLNGQQSPSMGFPYLVVLELIDVNISGSTIEYLISTCPYLEQLTIHGSNSQHLVDLEVAGQSLSLKYLKITSCLHLKSIYLSAKNLLSFWYDSGVIEISFANVFRLEKLTVDFVQPKMARTVLIFPVLTHLKILNIIVCAVDDRTLLNLASLIKAAPSLSRIVVELLWHEPFTSTGRRIQSALKSPHQCLKEVEIVSFVGRSIDMVFVSYLIENAINLEKIIIDPLEPDLIGCSSEDEELMEIIQAKKKRAMNGAMKLKSKYSLGDKLVLRNFES